MYPLQAQDEFVRPQLWSNVYVAWQVAERFTLGGDVAYNVLLSQEAPWNEITTSVSGMYHFHPLMEAIAGIYIAGSKQSQTTRSFEYRPNLGFRIHSHGNKRWMVSNLSRLEVRIFRYSDQTSDLAFRFRNRTTGIVSLIKPSLVSDRNLMLFGYFEVFYNFNQEVRERFFNQFKYKVGFAYRHNTSWVVNLGLIYQDARDNIDEPVQIPVTVNTSWIFEWGIAYLIKRNPGD